ncbi:MAG TPA: hypothetical protein VLN45_11275 [Ignavibacteriaceae bacterium]|nr:hypothetical protein [Ignavibacteriaceae bacterium]
MHRLYVGSFFFVGIAVIILLTINGIEYYQIPVEERFFSENHSMLKPSGILGHGIGILGTLMMIFGVAIYMIRKRMRSLFNIGYLKHWLEFHIFLCTVGPILILYHTAFKFGGIVAVSFWSMVAVVLSGVIGRFIYVQIPRTIQGNELDIKQLNEMSYDISNRLIHEVSFGEKITAKIDQLSDLNRYKHITLGNSTAYIVKDFFNLKLTLAALKREMASLNIPKVKVKEILALTKSKMVLTRRIAYLRTMQKLFKYWHIVHLPFAITMFVIMLVHVAVTIIFGYKWIF